MSGEPGTRRRRIVRRVVAGVVTLVLLLCAGLAVLGYVVAYHPKVDPVPDEPVDAIMVLGPLEDWRVPMAEQLLREHKARNLVLSTTNLPWDALYCKAKHDWPAYCFDPDPSTTRGEALGFRKLAREHGWKTVMVITVDYHADRSRFIFERCLRQDVVVTGQRVADRDRERPYQMGYQVAGFLKELRLGRCPD